MPCARSAAWRFGRRGQRQQAHMAPPAQFARGPLADISTTHDQHPFAPEARGQSTQQVHVKKGFATIFGSRPELSLPVAAVHSTIQAV